MSLVSVYLYEVSFKFLLGSVHIKCNVLELVTFPNLAKYTPTSHKIIKKIVML